MGELIYLPQKGSNNKNEKPAYWGRRVTAGLALTALTLFGASQFKGNDKEIKWVDAVVQPGDSPQSLVNRYNGESVNVAKLGDELSKQPNVADGLIPGEKVRVPVESQQHNQIRPKPPKLP